MSMEDDDENLKRGNAPDNPVWTRDVREPLFVNDTEISRRLGINDKEWPRVRVYFEGEGLPKKDPVIKKRYWPAIEHWLNHRYGISDNAPEVPDGKENWE